MNSIRKHMEEYRNSIRVIENKIPKNRLPGNPLQGVHPASIAEILLEKLKECQSPEEYNTVLNSSKGSMKARKAHDFFGWMAMQGKNQENKLGAFLHEGFWQCCDTIREKEILEERIKLEGLDYEN